MNTDDGQFMGGQLLSVEQLAHMLHKSPASVRCDASRNARSLPPVCRLPGSKRLLWRVEDVHAWIATFVQREPSIQIASPTSTTIPRGRGRPRKTEQRV